MLYVNGVFTADESSMINLAINVGFLVIIGVIFAIAVIKFSRLNFITAELEELTFRLQKEYKEANGKNLWENYQDRGDVFESEELRSAFNKYRLRVKSSAGKRGSAGCDLEEIV